MRPDLDFILVFDGGSRGNPGPAYGSYHIQPAGKKLGSRGAETLRRRLSFGYGTNNEAEYQTLIAGLRAFLAFLKDAQIDPKAVGLEVRGDSRLVIRQLDGSWKAKDSRMRAFRDEAAQLLGRFGEVSLLHQDRAKTLRILGH